MSLYWSKESLNNLTSKIHILLQNVSKVNNFLTYWSKFHVMNIVFKGHGCFLEIWFNFRDGNLKRNAVKSEWKAKQQEAFFKSLKVQKTEWFVRLLCPQLILLTSAVKHNKFAIYFSCHHRNCLRAVQRDHKRYF